MFDNPNVLIASLLWGSLGVGFFIYGKKQRSMVPLFGGIVITGLSYFVESALWMSLASLGVLALMFFLNRRGY